MQTYIVIAEQGELKLLEQLGISTEDKQVIITGVGAFNILRSLRDIPRDAQLLNIGYAGSSNFAIGTWVEVSEVRLNHPNVHYEEPEYKLIEEQGQLLLDSQYTRAICYTNTDFVLASDYKDCVFDMELAFIAGMGFTHLRSLKYVSDNLSLHAYHDLTNGVE